MNTEDRRDTATGSALALADSLAALRKLIRADGYASVAQMVTVVVDALIQHQDFAACEVYLPASPGTPYAQSHGDRGSACMPALLGGLLTAEVFPLIIDDGFVFIEPKLHLRSDDWRGCLLGVPVVRGDQVLGGIVVWHPEPDTLLPWHENLLTMMAGVVAMAIGDTQAPFGAAGAEAEDAFATGRRPGQTLPSAQGRHGVAGMDVLTGFDNRVSFEAQVVELASQVPDLSRARFVLHVDIDRFRLIREYGGDLVAERVVRMLAELLRHEFGSEPLRGRLGIDEFALVVERRTLEQALATARSLARQVDGLRLSLSGQRYDVSISVGVARVHEGPGAGIAALRHAVQACRAAQMHGGGMAQAYTEKMPRPRGSRRDGRLLNRLTQALKDDELLLYAQLITPVPAGGHAIHPGLMHEILLRLADANGDLVGADAFLPVAERYGLSVRLDRWVVRQAFAMIAASRFAHDPDHRFTLNLSGHSIDDHRLLDFIIDQLDESGLSPGCICFEITETAAISDIVAAKEFIGRLREIGCEFALDDFGSGHSSFLYLRDLPVDYLKIDGELVRDIASDPVSLAFVRTIEGVGRLMGRKTIAEYVQSREIHDAIVDIGCDYAQGYWVGCPVPLADVLGRPDD